MSKFERLLREYETVCPCQLGIGRCDTCIETIALLAKLAAIQAEYAPILEAQRVEAIENPRGLNRCGTCNKPSTDCVFGEYECSDCWRKNDLEEE